MALCDLDVVPVGKVRFSRCHSALSGAAATATTRSDGANAQRITEFGIIGVLCLGISRLRMVWERGIRNDHETGPTLKRPSSQMTAVPTKTRRLC